ncbi:zinc finger protein 469 [Cricetulus griseus]|uniref:Zinc finger protein 469 n=1 Tax=Cricetulus griseus TaxID=10029 RepID=G3GRU5_CRIGR|nr:zinc finger protein 469 [Cricetulus griseus]XP_035294104.1 zinc finger protein 469 [Cricetulus griseus]XP_035294121.1 zinc finger protein 469 [Cricetulus griseus]EGV94089.1 Zinc finger protein 469 [Cricetulus griseus]
MPGERPPTLPRDLQLCQVASSLGGPSQHPLKDHSSSSRTTQGMRDEGSKAQAQGSPEAQLSQAKEVEPEDLLLRTQATAGQSCVQAYSWLGSGMESSHPQLHNLSTSRIRCILNEPPKNLQHGAPQVSETKAPRLQKTRARHRPSIPKAEALPSPEENGSQRCFQEAPSSFTSTNCTSPSATPGTLPQRTPQSSGTSPHRPASGPNVQAIGTNPWPPAAENSFLGANFGVPSAEPKPFPEGSRPSSPQGVSVPYPFPVETAQHEQAAGTVLYTFHQPLVAWSEGALGTNPAYPSLSCNPSQSGGASTSSDLGGTLSPPGAAHLVPSPFHDSLHKSLTKGLPEGPPPIHDRLGSPRGPPNPPPQRHFPGQGYGANGVGTSPVPLDTELPTPGPPPTHLPQLWDSSAVSYPRSTLGPAVAARTAFFEGQQLCLPQSPPLPWSPVLTAPRPSSHQMGVLSQLGFPRGSSEWQGDSQRALNALNTISRPGETSSALRSSPGQPSSSPRLLAYGGLKDPGTQSLFFGGTQPQMSPQGALSLPPPRVMGASPSESPLPSPATNTASSSTCSSLSPPSSSPANPSSEESQQPGPLRTSAFFLPTTHSQETSNPFPSPEPTHPTCYQSESAKAFPLPTEGPGTEDAFKSLEGVPFPHKSPSLGRDRSQGFPSEPPQYSAQHFSLSSASLDQLDVLLTCKQCDRNYSSLAAFLEHRPFCSLLLAKTKDGSLQPPGLPTPTTTSKAPTDAHSGLLEHNQTAPFLLTRDDQGDSKDDSLRTSFLPAGLAVTPFPLPTSDLDMEDDAKLDRLITEALNGMEYHSDNPEIDSSFIDVFADEEPSGSRGPSAGHSLNTQVGATPKNGTQSQLPSRVVMPEPQVPCTGDRGCSSRNRPKTRSLGLASAEADTTTLVKQQRRGKQFKLFQKEPSVTKGTNNPARVICLRPRKKGHSAEQPRPQDRRRRARKVHAHADHSIPRAASKETRSSKHLQLPSGKDPRKRRGRGGSWSKELIHKIVQQKNRCHRRQAPRGQVSHVSLLPARPPSTQKGRVKGQGCASESEEEGGVQQQDLGDPVQDCSRHSRQRWRQGKKRKKEDLAQDPRKVMRQEAGENRGFLSPKRTHSLQQSLDAREVPVQRGPEHTDRPTATPKHPAQVLTTTKTQEEAALDFPQEVKKLEVAAEFHPDITELKERSGSLASCGGESPRPAAPVPTQAGGPSHPETLSGKSIPATDAGCLLGTSGCMKPPSLHTREDSSAPQPGGCLAPIDKVADAFYTESGIPVFKNSGSGCEPDHCDRHSIGCPAAKRGPLPNSDTPCELFLVSKDIANCFPEDSCSKPLAMDTLPASSCYLGQDSMENLESTPPKNPPYPVEIDPGKVHSPLTLESTSLFTGLPEDGFDPPLYKSLSANRVTHAPLVCTGPLPKKLLTDPLYPPFLLLEEASPVLPGPFPGLSKGKAPSKKCSFEQTVPPSLPPGPEKGSDCSVTLMSNLCEDELEIKRLVTELESQLQGKGSTQGALGEPEEAANEGRMDPCPRQASLLPTFQATSPHRDILSAANLTGLEGSSSQQEGALRNPQKQWSYLASCHTGKATPPPGTQEDPGSGAPLSPAGFSLSFGQLQEASISNTDCQVPISDHLPNSNRQQAPLLHVESSAKHRSNPELLFSKNNEASATQENAPLLLPDKHTRGHSPDSCEAQEPCPSSSALEGFNSPSAYLGLEPNLMLKGDEGVTSPPSVSPSHGSKGHLESQAGSPKETMLTSPTAKDPGFMGESVPAGASPLSTLPSGKAWSHPMPDPSWVTGTPQEPACGSFPLLQDARAESEDNTQGLQPGDPSEASTLGAVKMSALTTDIQKQLRSKAVGHMGTPGQSKKTKGRGHSNRLRTNNWRSLGNPDALTKVRTHLEVRPARSRGACQGSRAARGFRKQALPSTSPTHPDGTPSISTLTAFPLQMEPAERSPEQSASPQLPAPSSSGLATCALSATSPATPTPNDLEPLPQEDPGTRVKPTRPPAPSSYRDLLIPYHQPAYTVLAPLGKTSCGQATKDAGSLTTPTSPITSHCGSEETLSHHSLLGTSSPKDPPLGPLGPTSFSDPVMLDSESPKGITVGTLEDSRKEELRTSPAHATAPPPGGPSSPKITINDGPLTGIPTKDDLHSDERLEVPDPHCKVIPPLSSPERTCCKDPSLRPQSSTPCPGHRESHSIIAVPTDFATLGTTTPDSQICRDEAATSIEEQDNPETPGAIHCDVTKVPRANARGMPTGLGLALTASLSCTETDFRSESPQHHTSISHHSLQKNPFSPQESKQRPRGMKKKPEPTEKIPAGPLMTCELCSASFLSRAGLSRHKARKHRPLGKTSSQLSPVILPTCQPQDSMTQVCQTPGKKSCKVIGKGRPSHSPMGPGHFSQPPPLQASITPEDNMGPELLKVTSGKSEGPRTPDTPLNQQPHTPGLIEQRKGTKVPASKPRKPHGWQAHQLHPNQGEMRSQRQDGEPADSPSSSERKSNRKGGKLRVRREKHGPGNTAHVTSDRDLSDPSATCDNHLIPLSLSPEGECRTSLRPPALSPTVGPRALEDAADMGTGALCTKEMPAEKAPQEWQVCQGTIEREHPKEQKADWVQWFWGPGEARALDISGEPSQAIESQPAEDSRGAKGRSDEGTGKGTSDLPDSTHGLEVDNTINSCSQSPINDPETLSGNLGPKGTTPEASSPGPREPLDLFDDEVSFSQLFPLDGRLTRKKNLRVYGKRCKKPKCPPKEPSSEVVHNAPLFSTRLPTDLSDSGSLCLSHEEEGLWDDEALSLPESLLLDRLLSSKAPGLDPWTPSFSLWAPDNREASYMEEGPPCFTENQDEWSEAIPQLHMVPAAWRDLELCSPACETPSSLGDMSPEPPNLEREHDVRLSGNASLPPLYIKDFEVLSTQLEIQDLCFLGPCDDLADLPNPGILDFQATANSQGPPNKRIEEAARARGTKGRDRPVKGRRASYKCRVCFQRFHSLGELDLHKLAHSPSPPPTCYMCVERRFSSRELLREHLWEKHVQGKAGPWACGMCLKEVADVWMYNQHLREHAARFARNGQTRRDLPGCLEGESTLTHFLNSIVEQASKPQRTEHSIGKASREALEQEGEAGKKIPRRRVKQKVPTAVTSSQDGTLLSLSPSTEAGSPSILTSSSGSAKTPPTPSPDPWFHSDSPLQAVPVHEDCKDPSRDCHHCGKQFPKPFKLQRHLAVHSPQRVYLCPQCPQIYPEHWELRVHLSLTHRVKEERELPHMPLYACELCANVMHVIRRSFVCSSCNYTFAKKEQFDRHMDKHLRSGQQPFTLRSVRRPGVPGKKTQVPQDMLPSKRHGVVVPSSTDRVPSTSSPTPSEGCLPALPLICSETAPSPILDQPSSQERPVDQTNHSLKGNNPPLTDQDLPPPSLSPFPAASAEGTGVCKPDRALEKPENQASLGSLEPCKWQTPPGEKRSLHLFSGKHRSLGTGGKCAPGCSPGDPSQLQKERLVTTHHMVPEGKIEVSSQKGSATKQGACLSSSKHGSAVPPSKVLKLPAPSRKPIGMGTPASGELGQSPEDRVKPSTSKAKLRPSSQGSGGLQPGTQTGGGSQPQPTSGQLQSEMASTPTEPSCLSWESSTPDQPPPQVHTKGSARGSRETEHQGVQVHSSPREKRENSEKKRKGQALGLARQGSMGNMGRVPSAPDKSSRAPRKQATPSRVPPVKSRPSSQSGRTRPQPSAQKKGDLGHTSEKGSFPQARLLSRPYKRVRAVYGVEHMEPRDHRTAEAQSDLLSQLFGQKLTSFKIPLKKDNSQ